MTVPTSVKEQALKAEELQKQLMNPPSEEGAHQKEPLENQNSDQVNTQQSAEPIKPEKKEEEPETKPQPAQASSDEDLLYWKHRFQVLKGKYDAEVPALRKEISDLNQSVSDLKNQQSAASQTAPEQVVTALNDLSQDEIDEFGPELIQLVQKVAGAQVKQANDQVNDLNQQLSATQEELQQIKNESAEDAEARFWATLQGLVPDVAKINSDPSFFNYLDGYDPATGMQRQVILSQHQKQLNAEGVAAIFNAFKQTVTEPQQQKVPDELQQPPKSNASESVQETMNARNWTRAEVKQFYTDAAQGKYTPEQKAAIEKDIFDAQKSGRVR